MYKKLIAIFSLAFSLVVCQVAFAECGEGMRTMIDSLKLDDAQKAKIKPILDQLKTAVKDNGPQLMDVSKQINQQVTSASMDQATVDGLIDKKTKMIGDMIKAKVAAKNQIFAVLNDQQKAELQTKFKALEEKMESKFKSCRDEE
ncbi:MAG: Spy/CpxP family protein refolding chaperone [Legionella sp.]|jgi:Spy/CpxP family protein refolding chaperone